MQKGKFGICLWFYAVLGFIFAIINQTLPCLLLLGFVIAAEQNEWATKQVMQALFLCLTRSLVTLIPAAIHSVAGTYLVFGGLLSALFYGILNNRHYKRRARKRCGSSASLKACKPCFRCGG